MIIHILRKRKSMRLVLRFLKQRLSKSILQIQQRMQLIPLVLTLLGKILRAYPMQSLFVMVLTLLSLTIIQSLLVLTLMGGFVILTVSSLIGLLQKLKSVLWRMCLNLWMQLVLVIRLLRNYKEKIR